jgi:hypothetical protein
LQGYTGYDIRKRFGIEGGRLTVYAIASARQPSVTTTADIFQERITALLSWRSGQKRSKKKAAPKIVATEMPIKMLYEAIPT